MRELGERMDLRWLLGRACEEIEEGRHEDSENEGWATD